MPKWLLTRQAVHVDSMRRQTDAHVPVPALGDDPDLEIVQAARRRYGVRRAHAGCVFVCLSMS